MNPNTKLSKPQLINDLFDEAIFKTIRRFCSNSRHNQTSLGELLTFSSQNRPWRFTRSQIIEALENLGDKDFIIMRSIDGDITIKLAQRGR